MTEDRIRDSRRKTVTGGYVGHVLSNFLEEEHIQGNEVMWVDCIDCMRPRLVARKTSSS